MPVHVLTLALVVAQVVPRRECILDRNLVHESPSGPHKHRWDRAPLPNRLFYRILGYNPAHHFPPALVSPWRAQIATVPMNVLLLSMPDSFEHMPTVAIRMPNGGLSSIAGNVDPHHRVAIADLVLVQKSVRETLLRLTSEFDPDVVGLSVMTFQRRTASRIIELLRLRKPSIRIVVGGYDPSLAREADEKMALDFIVRGEGELTFRELLRALEVGSGFDRICGLSYQIGAGWVHNPDRPVGRLKDGEVRPPNRAARVLKGYTLLGRPVDVVETSRGCTYDCSFCSIIEMRGRNFHTYSFQRVLDDIRDARDRGARAIF